MATKSKTAQMEAAEIPVADLVVNPKNPRRHPAAQLDKLAASLRRFGQPRPLIVRAANRMIIAGHGIAEAATRAGMKTVKVLLWDTDQRTADAYMVADNKLPDGAKDDRERIAALVRELREQEDMQALGFDSKEVDAMLASPEELVVAEVDTSPVADSFWIAVKGPLTAQAEILRGLKRLADKFPDVEVELSTVERP
jgi:ParB family transcriptional regulator, chromosome partitioning protein